MSNSSLVSYTKISPNRTSPRNHVIDTITIHCVVGQLSAEGICGCFTNPSVKASCNYGIGTDGRIALCVEEKDRSWCSSSSRNDNRAITIECASDMTHPYAINDKVYKSLIELCADICRRNNIKELKWKADKSLIGQVDKQNMTVHRWFANKACPGDYIYNRLGNIASEVNAKLGVSGSTPSVTPTPSTSSGQLYRIRKSWLDASSQIGAYKSLENAKNACPNGYFVYDENGNVVYPKTESAEYSLKSFIRDIQSACGASVDGIAGPETLSKTVTISAKTNRTHPAVKCVQKRLRAMGYTEVGTVDGIAGSKFTTAVRRYQSNNGCYCDGEITARNTTWKKLLGIL